MSFDANTNSTSTRLSSSSSSPTTAAQRIDGDHASRPNDGATPMVELEMETMKEQTVRQDVIHFTLQCSTQLRLASRTRPPYAIHRHGHDARDCRRSSISRSMPTLSSERCEFGGSFNAIALCYLLAIYVWMVFSLATPVAPESMNRLSS